MTREQEQALEQLHAKLARFEAAYAEMLVATQEVDLAMAECRRVNDVQALITA